MRRVVLLLGAAAFVAVLAVLGWTWQPAQETTTLATAPASSLTTGPTTTTTGPAATTATVPAVEILPLPAAEVLPAGFAPLVAVSATEVWAVVGTPEDAACVIGHLKDQDWAYWGLTDPAARFRDVVIAPDGTVWAATDAGVFSFDGAAWTRRHNGPTGGIAADGAGTVWIAGNLPGAFPTPWLARGDGDRWERLDEATPPGEEGSTRLAVLPEGEAWLAAYPGRGDLMHYDGRTLKAVPVDGYPDPAGPEGAVAVFTVEAAPNGDLWVGGCLASDPLVVILARFDGREWTLYDWPLEGEGQRPALLFDLAAAHGAVWLGGETGLASFDGAGWSPEVEGVWVLELDVAPDGTVWYSDLAGGLHSLPPP